MSSTTTEMTTEAREAATEEISRLIADLYDAFGTGDPEPWTSCLSEEHAPTAFGTDPLEYWSGREKLLAVVDAQVREMNAAGISLQSGTPVINVRSDVAWVADQPTLRTGDGAVVPLRLTILLTSEDDAWRMAHFHLSVGVRNESMLDTTLTV
jgi:ketosteroid isomerase-like protein